MYMQNRNKVTCLENKLVVTSGGKAGERGKIGEGY